MKWQFRQHDSVAPLLLCWAALFMVSTDFQICFSDSSLLFMNCKSLELLAANFFCTFLCAKKLCILSCVKHSTNLKTKSIICTYFETCFCCCFSLVVEMQKSLFCFNWNVGVVCSSHHLFDIFIVLIADDEDDSSLRISSARFHSLFCPLFSAQLQFDMSWSKEHSNHWI